jgi:MFS family permease
LIILPRPGKVEIVSDNSRPFAGRRSKRRRGKRSDVSRPGTAVNRAALFRVRNFRRFYAGYATSMLGSSMSAVALTFAVLDSGGTATDLGFVFAAEVVPQVIFMLGGGVVADRFGRRPVMLAADAARLAAQASLAVTLFAGRPPIWLFVLLAALLGTGEAFFTPALGALTVDIAPRDRLSDANALLGMARSTAQVIGPSLAGVLIGVTSPALVIAIDAGSYCMSVLALSLLDVPAGQPPRRSPLRDLADGWSQFRSQTWLWVTTLQFALFNLFTWAPYLLLGPVLAREYLGGARAWGAILAAYAGGAILTGAALVGRRPKRLLTVAVLGTFGYPVPCLMLALHAPSYLVAAGAAVAGAGSTLCGTFFATALQQRVAPEALARVNAFSLTGSFALGSAGYAVVGPVAAIVGPARLLGFSAAWGLVSSAVVLALPSIRSVSYEPSRGTSRVISPRLGDDGASSRAGPARGAADGELRGTHLQWRCHLHSRCRRAPRDSGQRAGRSARQRGRRQRRPDSGGRRLGRPHHPGTGRPEDRGSRRARARAAARLPGCSRAPGVRRPDDDRV